MDRWIDSAAGGTSQRLQPGGATIRSRLKKDAFTGVVYHACGPVTSRGDSRKLLPHWSIPVQNVAGTTLGNGGLTLRLLALQRRMRAGEAQWNMFRFAQSAASKCKYGRGPA